MKWGFFPFTFSGPRTIMLELASQSRSKSKPPKPTIFSVARSAGVSITAVSLILNHPGKHRYSSEVERRVQEACRKLRYKPNSMARSLAKQTNPGIGLLCDSLSDFNITRAVQRVVEIASANGLHVVVTTNPSKIPWQNLLDEGRVSWIIAIGDYMIDRAKELQSPHFLNRIISVCSGPIPPETMPVAFRVTWDSNRHGLLAADHLASLGHKEVGILAGRDVEIETATQRVSTAYHRLSELGIKAHWITDASEDRESMPRSGQLQAQALLDRHPNTTAIICRNDYHAVGAYREIHRRWLEIPRQMAVVGNFNLQSMLYLDPPLTSVDAPLVQAVERAMGFIASQEHAHGVVELSEDVKLIVRESTTPKS